MKGLYFIAIVCPEELNRVISVYKNRMLDAFGCKAALRSPAHITLLPPFYADESSEKKIKQFICSFSFPHEVRVIVKGFNHFTDKVIYAAVEKNPLLQQLKNELDHHISSSGMNDIQPGARPFHPHITIANRDLKKEDFETAWKKISTEKISAEFTTTELSLLKLSQGLWNIVYRHNWLQ